MKPSRNGNLTFVGNEIYGGQLDGIKVLFGRRITKNIIYWGWSQKHKFRSFSGHIDLGIISIYGLKRKKFWKIIAFLILPLRKYYRKKYCDCDGWQK